MALGPSQNEPEEAREDLEEACSRKRDQPEQRHQGWKEERKQGQELASRRALEEAAGRGRQAASVDFIQSAGEPSGRRALGSSRIWCF